MKYLSKLVLLAMAVVLIGRAAEAQSDVDLEDLPPCSEETRCEAPYDAQRTPDSSGFCFTEDWMQHEHICIGRDPALRLAVSDRRQDAPLRNEEAGTKEALKLQIEEISGWLKDKDARIAHLENLLSTIEATLAARIRNSKHNADLIAGLESQLATAIERADELLTGQDEVGRTQSSTGLFYDEAREHCSTSAACQVILEQTQVNGVYVSNGEWWRHWRHREGAGEYVARVARSAFEDKGGSFNLHGGKDFDRAAAMLTVLGTAEWPE